MVRDDDDGVIYFVQCSETLNIKIGFTTSLKKRLASLQVGSASKLILIGYIKADATVDVEAILHGSFSKHRIHGEWFRPAPEILTYLLDRARRQFLFDEYGNSQAEPSRLQPLTFVA